jgi:hypothetical protein
MSGIGAELAVREAAPRASVAPVGPCRMSSPEGLRAVDEFDLSRACHRSANCWNRRKPEDHGLAIELPLSADERTRSRGRGALIALGAISTR